MNYAVAVLGLMFGIGAVDPAGSSNDPVPRQECIEFCILLVAYIWQRFEEELEAVSGLRLFSYTASKMQ